MEKQFVNRDITVKKSDSSFVRGVCISENEKGVTVLIKNTNREVFIPFGQVIEIVYSRNGKSDNCG